MKLSTNVLFLMMTCSTGHLLVLAGQMDRVHDASLFGQLTLVFEASAALQVPFELVVSRTSVWSQLVRSEARAV